MQLRPQDAQNPGNLATGQERACDRQSQKKRRLTGASTERQTRRARQEQKIDIVLLGFNLRARSVDVLEQRQIRSDKVARRLRVQRLGDFLDDAGGGCFVAGRNQLCHFQYHETMCNHMVKKRSSP